MKNRSHVVLSLAILVLCCSLGFIGFLVSDVYAAEGGGNHYPGGNEDFMAGALPPPGFYFLNYLDYFNSHALDNNHGDAQRGLGFQLNVVAEVPRFLWVTKTKLLGGDVVGHILIPWVYEYAAVNTPVGRQTQAKYGLGDIEIGTGIAWHPSKNFHHILAFDVVAPTGQFDKTDLVNIGRNYWSFNPLWAFTYRADNGFEASAKLMYWINTVNSDTSYVSGQEFSADYLLGWHYQKWGFGANGHYRLQTTDDTKNGHTAVDAFTGAPTGNKAEFLSIGPAITYDLPKGCITFKYQFGVEAKNVPMGNSLWLKFIWAL